MLFKRRVACIPKTNVGAPTLCNTERCLIIHKRRKGREGGCQDEKQVCLTSHTRRGSEGGEIRNGRVKPLLFG